MSINNYNVNALALGGDTIYDYLTYDSFLNTSNSYRVHVFKNNGIFNVLNPGQIDVFVVGGGAGGGVNVGGGGGGIQFSSNLSIITGSVQVTIGAGGNPFPDTTAGGQSSFGSFVIAGGGNIGIDNYQGGTTGNPQNYLGNTVNYANFAGAAGGGGAGGGTTSGYIPDVTSNGIIGIQKNITGTNIYYAGGGGGSGSNAGYDAPGGLGGGGYGSFKTTNPAINAVANTGGGGGACGKSLYTGGKGGSGIIIIRYPSPVTDKCIMTHSNQPNQPSIATFINIPTPTGPTISYTGNPIVNSLVVSGLQYTTYGFSNNGTITLTAFSGLASMDILVVGGGGGGSSNGNLQSPPGNGGGGGEVIYLINQNITASPSSTVYQITIGSGGLSDQNGVASSFSNITTISSPYSIIARGGLSGTLTNGGANGNRLYYGAGYFSSFQSTGEILTSGSGGGGAASLGVQSSLSQLGLGGDAVGITITGTPVYYGAGGGGGGLRSSTNGWLQTTGANGGSGGGITNVNTNAGGGGSTNAQSASVNRGGGGGGGGQNGGGGSGGSGYVLIRLQTTLRFFLNQLNTIFTSSYGTNFTNATTNSTGAVYAISVSGSSPSPIYGAVYIYSLLVNGLWNTTPYIIQNPLATYSFGTELQLSGDGNTIAIADTLTYIIYVYRYITTWGIPLTLSPPGSVQLGLLEFGTKIAISYDGNYIATFATQTPSIYTPVIYTYSGGWISTTPFASLNHSIKTVGLSIDASIVVYVTDQAIIAYKNNIAITIYTAGLTVTAASLSGNGKTIAYTDGSTINIITYSSIDNAWHFTSTLSVQSTQSLMLNSDGTIITLIQTNTLPPTTRYYIYASSQWTYVTLPTETNGAPGYPYSPTLSMSQDGLSVFVSDQSQNIYVFN
jgi:hypothetical protein